MTARVRLRSRIEYTAVRGLAALAGLLSPAMTRGLGWLVSRVWFAVQPARRKRALDNLARVFPELTPKERGRLARASFQHCTLVLLEGLRASGQTREEQLQSLDLSAIDPAVAKEIEAGGGAIFVGGHQGNFELLPAVVAALTGRVTGLYRPLGNKLLDAWLRQIRDEIEGVSLENKKGGVRPLMRALGRKESVGLLVDHDAGNKGLFVPFLGISASTTPVPATLSYHFNVPIYVLTGHRKRDGRHAFRLSPPLRPESSRDRASEVKRLTTRINDAISDSIRSHPEQWTWMHRRYKTKPRMATSAS